MPLVEYTPPRRAITANEGQVLGEVQGLSLEHVAVLVREHLPDLEAVADLFQQGGGVEAFSVQDWKKLALPFITQAPGLVANVIAVAANEPKAAPTVQSWPMSMQLRALVDIFDLSFAEIGEVKKAVELVVALLKAKKK